MFCANSVREVLYQNKYPSLQNIMSGQDEQNLALWLATRASKMEISWPLGIRALSRKENLSWWSGILSHIIWNPLLTKLVRSRWLDIGKLREKELGQYPAILTEQAWSLTHNYMHWRVGWLLIFKSSRTTILGVQSFASSSAVILSILRRNLLIEELIIGILRKTCLINQRNVPKVRLRIKHT